VRLGRVLRRLRIGVDGHLRSDLADRARIAREQGIGGEQGDPLHQCLGDQDAVERVFVQRRQEVEGDRVGTRDRHFGVAVVEQTAAEQPGVGVDVGPAKLVFDRDLPQAGSAEEQIVGGVFEQGARVGRARVFRPLHTIPSPD